MNLRLCEKYLSVAKKKTHNLLPDEDYVDLETYHNFVEDLWFLIKINQNIMEEAIQVTKDKFGNGDTLNGLNVCEQILLHRQEVPEISNRLIRIILSNKDILRIPLSIPQDYIRRISFLGLVLYDKSLKLNSDEKEVILRELKRTTSSYEIIYLILN